MSRRRRGEHGVAMTASIGSSSSSSTTFRFPLLLSFLLLHGLLIPAVSADCECGYAASIGTGPDAVEHVFTDLIETDFSRLADVAANTDWQRQAFNVSRERARGAYGEMFAVENIAANPRKGIEEEEEEAGLRLVVRSDVVNDMVPVAEIDTMRLDVLYGTFRAGLKITDVPGTCSAFFWYYNDTQEIDMEFLSKDFNATNGTFPVNLVLQSRRAAESGFDAQRTGTFVRANLPFDPTLAFHEYRIDFLPGRVLFYADNVVLARMQDDDDDQSGGHDGSGSGSGEVAGAAAGPVVPRHAGHLVLQHWSNGNPLWSGGPPAPRGAAGGRDAVTAVAYVKAYFNSSAGRRREDWRRRCGGDDPGREKKKAAAVCRIPEVTAANLSAREFFFSAHPRMVPNQTVSRNGDGGGGRWRRGSGGGVVWSAFLFTVLVLVV